MVSVGKVAERLASHPDHRFVVHDGYAGWSYGSPLNPTVITPEAAVYLLNHALPSEPPESGLADESGGFPSVQFAEARDALYKRCGRNRFVQFIPLAWCLFEPGWVIGPPVDFGLGGTDRDTDAP